ncbi:trypsin-like peptidase domain-containing protein [Staphylococcus pseudintermedius]|uniref:trypsin-like serine peptidase n=1 Tax=Staphylococcus pseudintermedius TaxID=283734 RepID=UPI001A01B3AB|nr:serine protease [Staphylococcus pseudintermedius]EGQ0374298.1 trypsin-like peptidase domain-containing protein [Staphylococcus pseudintermedius]EGQ3210627.1 trypsin-like peptidase domain-containing protein [Staphylococcus pseudintermedius]EGQ3512137.1 trypsin-like peptidase domain-containing protein [Staphylococcus pseudintermedius]EGQ3921546.1 serine protease [Staphylococcus pseudintermedius]EGQ4199722.1 trypsin-like peptidase domain-containing protein [Staphylococcus pseudintermedius]
MKKLHFLLLLSLVCFVLLPVDTAFAKKGTQVIVPDTVADPHSKYTAKYESADHSHCTAILISSTVALTAKHCGGNHPTTDNGTIYPGESGLKTPFGYMNISTYIPNSKYDIAILKGTEKDQSKDYHYYIKPFKTAVTGFTDDTLDSFVGLETYSYGYPYKFSGYKQYRSDGEISFYQKNEPILRTTLPTHEGQSGSGAFLKDGRFVGIIITRTQDYEGNVLPFNQEIADWVNKNAN